MSDCMTDHGGAQVPPDQSSMSAAMLEAALRYAAHGLSVIPVGVDKRPLGSWARWQNERADAATIRTWFRDAAVNVAVICGKISGDLLAIDFDEPRVFESWRKQIGELADGLPIEQTPRGGFHVFLRCENPGSNKKLAFIADESETSGRRVAIETRGEGGYVVVSPSANSRTARVPVMVTRQMREQLRLRGYEDAAIDKLIPGEAWEILGGMPEARYVLVSGDLSAIPFVSQAHADSLLDAARRLDECPITCQDREARAPLAPKLREGASVIDAYDAKHSIDELLQRHGYTRKRAEQYIRPNGEHASVTVRDERSFHHNANDPLCDGYWHSAFDVFCKLEHVGDVRAAVRAAAEELGLTESCSRASGPNLESAGQYLVKDGRISRRKPTRDGEMIVPLCNFAAQIVEEVERDDGADVTRVLKIEGTRAGGSHLPTARVDASQFPGMRWVFPQWGTRAIVEAGQSNQDHLRAAIQYLSSNASTRRVYTHTGWRDIGGKMFYLTQSGALGGEPVAVELDKELERYRLPIQPTNVRAAMDASLRFLKIAPLRVSLPLWAAMYLAPLTPILPPTFMIWVYGVTGALKTTLSALALSHFGDFTEHDLLMWSATANALEKYAFLVKDAPLLVDDFAPQSDPTTARKLEETAGRLVRGVGNRTGRARMKSDLSLRELYRPRGLVIATGEQIPDGQSVVARLCTIEMKKGDIDLAQLSQAQEQREEYRHAMAGYVLWLADHWNDLEKTLPNAWSDLRVKARTGDHHLRLPEFVASLYIGFEVGLNFALEIGALSAEEDQELRDEAWRALLEIAEHQHRIVEEERPARVFLSVLADLLTQQKVRLSAVDSPSDSGEGDLIGWYDAEYVYLIPSVSYHRVAQFTRDEGRLFVKENTVRKALAEEGVLETTERHYTSPKQIGGKLKRVLKLRIQKAEKLVGVSLH